MFKVLRPIKDAYITDRVIDGTRVLETNTGGCASLDTFKIYGLTTTLSGTTHLPNTELSRLLIKFDLQPLKDMVTAGQVDPTNSSFSCRLHLYDVYGGQPTPSNFTLSVFPLSASFDEGAGRDVVLYSDSDVCNFLSSSRTSGAWFVSGCAGGGDDSGPCDYLSASHGVGLHASQVFPTGVEDLDLDITTIVSASLTGAIPDQGFRVSFDAALEQDQHTYFVKRFASRTAYNDDLHPKLFVRFDDSAQDDSSGNLFLDSPGTLFLYNYVASRAAPLSSASLGITGSNSLLLELVTPVSGGNHSLFFTGSQHGHGTYSVVGVYSASVIIPSTDPVLVPQLAQSGSITFTPIWQSLDRTLVFLTGSAVKVWPPQRGSNTLDPRRFQVTVLGLRDVLAADEQTVLRVNIFDYTAPYLKQASRLPVELPGVVVRDVHYQVRDAVTNLIAVPFDTLHNSTRVSNDATGMFFALDTSNLTAGHSYVIDIMVVTGGNKQLYKGASQTFKVDPAL